MLEFGTAEESLIRSDEVDTNTGGLFEGEIARLGRNATGGDNEEFGVTAVSGETYVTAAAPHLGVENTRRTVDNEASEISTGSARKRGAGHFAL